MNMRSRLAVCFFFGLLAVACKKEPGSVVAQPAPPKTLQQQAEPLDASAPAEEPWTARTVTVSREEPPAIILKTVRSARHDGFDRVVFEFEGSRLPGYQVEYVDKPVEKCGSGAPVAIPHDGLLRVRMSLAQAHTDEGEATVTDSPSALKLPNLQVLRMICDFEGQVEYVLGLNSPNGFRVQELAGPARLVVDVKH